MSFPDKQDAWTVSCFKVMKILNQGPDKIHRIRQNPNQIGRHYFRMTECAIDLSTLTILKKMVNTS